MINYKWVKDCTTIWLLKLNYDGIPNVESKVSHNMKMLNNVAVSCTIPLDDSQCQVSLKEASQIWCSHRSKLKDNQHLDVTQVSDPKQLFSIFFSVSATTQT